GIAIVAARHHTDPLERFHPDRIRHVPPVIANSKRRPVLWQDGTTSVRQAAPAELDTAMGSAAHRCKFRSLQAAVAASVNTSAASAGAINQWSMPPRFP